MSQCNWKCSYLRSRYCPKQTLIDELLKTRLHTIPATTRTNARNTRARLPEKAVIFSVSEILSSSGQFLKTSNSIFADFSTKGTIARELSSIRKQNPKTDFPILASSRSAVTTDMTASLCVLCRFAGASAKNKGERLRSEHTKVSVFPEKVLSVFFNLFFQTF